MAQRGTMQSHPSVHMQALAFLYDRLADFPTWVRQLTPGQMAQFATILVTWRNTVTSTNQIAPMEEVEKSEITRAITACGGDVCAAAKALGIGKTTIYRKLKAWGYSTADWQIVSQAAALAQKPRTTTAHPGKSHAPACT